MLSLTDLKTSVADLTAKVQRATTVEAGVALTVKAIVQQNKDLQAQIAGLNPETITQADLDGIKQQIADSSTALSQGTDALAAATADVSGVNKTDPAGFGAVSGASSGSSAFGQTDALPAPAPADSGAKPQPLGGTSPEERAAANTPTVG